MSLVAVEINRFRLIAVVMPTYGVPGPFLPIMVHEYCFLFQLGNSI